MSNFSKKGSQMLEKLHKQSEHKEESIYGDNKMSDNAPERIWIDVADLPINFNESHDGMISAIEVVGRKEYIRNNIADKNLDNYKKLVNRIVCDIDDVKDRRLREILQPIRDFIKEYAGEKFEADCIKNALEHMAIYTNNMEQVIRETLRRADNAT